MSPRGAVQDLSKVCLPVYFNEPTSALQKIAEELEYSSLLDEVRHLHQSHTNLHLSASTSASERPCIQLCGLAQRHWQC